jgi:TrmH family RNA methyltransferase
VTSHIESLSNTRIAAIVRLKKRRQRESSGTFLIEGTREAERALAAGTSIAEAFVCPEYATAETRTLADNLARTGIRLTTTSTRVFDRISQRQNPDGIVAVASVWDPSLEGLASDLTLVAESIEKPGNLGAMFRTADAAGSGLLIADPNVDPFNPNVVRASQGALFSVPFAVADTATAIGWALRRGSLFVATPDADVEFWDADLTGITTIVIGSEHAGVSAAWRRAGTPVRIPMAGHADSLNASVSAAVMLFEAVRQRGQA